ncbi:MAG: DUF4349 domain-containing protein [Spirochaetales bacterium]|nr:DUF4349 domain-containing protein [Spirochaetales bacterium]
MTPKGSLPLILILLLLIVSCKEILVETPARFAALELENQFAAMSPEGMVYRVRVMSNSPPQTLEFWTEALTNHLEREGYVPVSADNGFSAGGVRGSFSEWTVPYRNDTYKYLTGVLVGEATLAVAEASGSHEVYDRHRAAVLERLETIDFEGVEAQALTVQSGAGRPVAPPSATEREVKAATASTGCFLAGTPVLTREGMTAIEAVWPGTPLSAYDPATGTWTEQIALRAIVLPYAGDLISIDLGGPEAATIEVTGSHPFLVASGRRLARRPLPEELSAAESLSPTAGRWVEARHLRKGDSLLSLEAPGRTVTSVSRRHAALQVYHLSVSGPHTYAVEDAGLVVHNGGEAERTYKAPVESKYAAREREIIGGGAITASLPTDARSERVRVYSGACSLVIDRVEETKRRIANLAEQVGGYVEQSTEARIVLRVPAGAFRRVFDDILELGEVVYKAIETYDVTDQFTDPAGRLAVAIRARDRLYVLVNRVEDAKERLEILKKIREYTETIERLELSLQVLEQRIAMSRITVELHPRLSATDEGDRPIPFGWIERLHPLYATTAGPGSQVQLTLPEDVAVFQEQGALRAEAADGTRVRVGTVKNDPRGDSLFWQQALIYHVKDRYREAQGIPGEPVALALFASKDRDPYYYLVGAAPLPGKPTLVVFEAYFPDQAALERHRAGLLDAFGKVELK